jgi:hypothetical protein
MTDYKLQLDFIRQGVQDRIVGIKGRISHYRNIAFWSHIGSAALAAIISFLLAIKAEGKILSEAIRLVSLLITCSITVIGAYNAFYSHKEMWIANNEALNEFYSLQFDMEFFLQGKGEVTEQTLGEFKKRYDAILRKLNEGWSKARANINPLEVKKPTDVT